MAFHCIVSLYPSPLSYLPHSFPHTHNIHIHNTIPTHVRVNPFSSLQSSSFHHSSQVPHYHPAPIEYTTIFPVPYELCFCFCDDRPPRKENTRETRVNRRKQERKRKEKTTERDRREPENILFCLPFHAMPYPSHTPPACSLASLSNLLSVQVYN